MRATDRARWFSWARAATLVAVASCLAALAIRAVAQQERGAERQPGAAFDAYDLEGPATLDAIRRLAPDERSTPAPELRLARIRAATDLWLISLLDRRRSALEEQLAQVFEVPTGALAATLRAEVEAASAAIEGDVLGAELRKAIALREAIAEGSPLSFGATDGVRRDALLLYVSSKAVADRDDGDLAPWFDDPCGHGASCDDPWTQWAVPSRSIVAALADADGALARLEAASESGDPFARAVLPTMREASQSITAHVHHPSPLLPDSLSLSPAAYDDGEPARADLVVVADRDQVGVVRVARVRIREGRPERIDEGPGVLPDVRAVPLPASATEAASFGALAESLRTSGAEGDARVAAGAAESVPAERLQRVLAAMVRAEREPRALLRRATDGTLRAVPIRVVSADVASDDDTLVVELRPTGYAVAGGGIEPTEIPRAESASLGPLDEAALDTLIGSVPDRRVVLRAVGELPATELVDTAFAVAEEGDLVALVGQ